MVCVHMGSAEDQLSLPILHPLAEVGKSLNIYPAPLKRLLQPKHIVGLFSFVLAQMKQLLDVICGFWYEIGSTLHVTPVWQTCPNCCANIPI